MAYQSEFAGSNASQEAMKNTQSIDNLKSLRLTPKNYQYDRLDSVFTHNYPHESQLKYAVIFDGSKYESEIDSQYLSKLVLLNVNQSIVSLGKLQKYLKSDFPLPQEYQEITQNNSIQVVLPTQGFSSEEYPNENDFFRYSLYKTLSLTYNPLFVDKKDNLSLLDTYKNLLKYADKNKVNTQPCPICYRLGHEVKLKDFMADNGTFKDKIHCKCQDNPKEIYMTDLLGFHLQLNSETSNEALTTQIMLVLEKIILINLIQGKVNNEDVDFIKSTAFIVDGSLALYSHASWLVIAIHKTLLEIQEKEPILLFSVEKSGSFVEHVKKIENHFQHNPTHNKSLFAFEDNYIKEYIKTYDNDNYYGENTYFGKKLFYKNIKSATFVLNIAYSSEEDKVLLYNERNNKEYLSNIYRIQDIVWLLDSFSSNAYDNAFSLLSFAHKGAALSSSSLNKSLLDKFLKNVLP